MKCKLLRAMPKKNSGLNPTHPKRYVELPAGSIIDHKHAFLLVQQGVAEPADDECARAAGRTPEQIAKASATYDEILAGIHPDDRELFRAGKITGYRPDYDPSSDPPSTQYLVGPNWTDDDAAAIDDGVDPDEDDHQPDAA